MNSLAQDVIDLLVDELQGYAGGSTDTYDTGWVIFNQHQPKTPVKCVVVREYEGPPPVVPLNMYYAEFPLENLRFQVAVRATTDDEARLKAQSIAKLLTNYGPFIVISTDAQDGGHRMRYGGIVLISTPIPLATEEKGVYIWVVNFKAARQEEAVVYP